MKYHTKLYRYVCHVTPNIFLYQDNIQLHCTPFKNHKCLEIVILHTKVYKVYYHKAICL
jgi:hypothetical protein